jgi:thiol:disulfide interchange protein
VDHEQKKHEKHRLERQEKQAEERRSEENFSKPGPTVHPLWFLAIGLVLAFTALIVWMMVWA